MSMFYNLLRFLLQFLLLIIYGKYLSDVISPLLFLSFFLFSLLPLTLSVKIRFRFIPAFLLIGFWPWIIRWLVIVIQKIFPSFLQISFDMNFFFLLLPVYLFSLLSWLTLTSRRFGKYEVLANGFLLFLLFYSQGNYKVSLFHEPLWLALFSLFFLFLEILVLYLAVARERAFIKKPGIVIKETLAFFIILLPLVIFLLLPIWREYEDGSVAGGGGLLKSSLFRFDFSEYIKLETEISMSDDLVLMFRKEGPAERLLLRRYVLSGYEDGQGFYRHDMDKTSPPDTVPTRYKEYGLKNYKNRKKVHQELFLVNIDPGAFLSLNYPVDVQPVYNWDNSSFVRIYQSDAMVNSSAIREIDPLSEMSDEALVHYTYSGSNESLKKMAEEITKNIPGALLKVEAIERYFHENYYYSLKPGVAPDGDQLSWFLEESKKGYCSYFAFAMALMCRSIGIPARVAVGFWVDPDVSVLNFYPVRADQAHAWVEVYFSDYGWMEYDPTSSTLYPGEQYPFAGFTIDEFSPYIEEILDNELVPENLKEAENSSEGDINNGIGQTLIHFVRSFWPIAVLSLYGIFFILYHFSYYILFLLNRSDRMKARYLYGKMRRLLAFEKKSYRSTILDFAKILEDEWQIPFVEFTKSYQKSLYSSVFSHRDLQDMILLQRETMQGYREAFSKFKRILYFIFPFLRKFPL